MLCHRTRLKIVKTRLILINVHFQVVNDAIKVAILNEGPVIQASIKLKVQWICQCTFPC